MRKIFSIIIFCMLLVFSINCSASYLPMTNENCTQLLQDVRNQFYTTDLPDVKNWDSRLQGLTVTFDPNTSSRQYFADTYGLFIAEEYTVVGCPAWPLYIEELRSPEEPNWTIPQALFKDTNAPLYWVLNSQFLEAYPPNGYALKGLIIHELGHVIDHSCDFTAKTALILGNDRMISYSAREWMNDMYVLATKGRLGSIILQYEFAKWLHSIMPPIPIEHPFIDNIPLIPTIPPDRFKEKVLQDFERELLYNPNIEPEQVLGNYYNDYVYLMNN